MRRIPLSTLLLASLFGALVVLFAALRLGRALRPHDNVITHEIKDLVATFQATLQAPFGVAADASKSSLHVLDPAGLILLGAGVMALGALTWRLWAVRRRQQRSRNRAS